MTTTPIGVTAEAAWPALPPYPTLPHGGVWSGHRTFDPSAIQAPAQHADPDPVTEPVVPSAPEQDIPPTGCDRLNGTCDRHQSDGAASGIVHWAPLRTEAGPFGKRLLEHQLVQFGDDTPVMSFVGDGLWPDLDLPGVDALIEAAARQLARLRESRNELAAALGEPLAEPPERPGH